MQIQNKLFLFYFLKSWYGGLGWKKTYLWSKYFFYTSIIEFMICKIFFTSTNIQR